MKNKSEVTFKINYQTVPGEHICVNGYNAIPYATLSEIKAMHPDNMRILCGSPLQLFELNAHQLKGALALLQNDWDEANKNGIVVCDNKVLYQDRKGLLFKITAARPELAHTYVHQHDVICGMPMFFDLNCSTETAITCSVKAPSGNVSRQLHADGPVGEHDDIEARARRMWRAEMSVTIDLGDPLADGFSHAIAAAVHKDDREELLQMRRAAQAGAKCAQSRDSAGVATHANRVSHYRSLASHQAASQRRTSGR